MQMCKIVSDKICYSRNILTDSAKMAEKDALKPHNRAWHEKCIFYGNTFCF